MKRDLVTWAVGMLVIGALALGLLHWAGVGIWP